MDSTQQALLLREIAESIERYVARVDLVVRENDNLVEISRRRANDTFESLARWRVGP